MNILLLTNSAELASFIKTGLEENNCNVEVAYDIFFGERILNRKKFDVIILDIDLAESNHFELSEKIRNHDSGTPVIFLTEMDPVKHNVKCIDFAADDYVLKPVNLNELIFRINVFNKKNKEAAVRSYVKFSNLEVDTAAKIIKRGNKEIKLTAREYKLLELLLLNQGRVLDRMEIAEKIWGFNIKAGVNVINVHMNTLRNKIDKGFTPKLIHTLIGLGYVMRVGD
jgi:two-component system, OmpR family, copper resistance phosphate regulon response regulator CusR